MSSATQTQRAPTVLIIGAGAIGAFFGSALARGGALVSVVCRSDFDIVRRDGFSIRSPLLGEHCFRPAEVLRSAQELTIRPDFVVLATKVVPDVDAIELLRPAIGPHSAVVLLQNGLDIEPRIATTFPEQELVSVVAFIAVSRTGPGQIHHQSVGSLTLGTYPSGIGERARVLGALWQAAGVPCRLTADIIGTRWQKALWNAAFNPLSIVAAGLDTATILGTPEGERLVRAIMDEIRLIAAAAGHSLDRALIDQLISATRGMPPYKTSMALDLEHGRSMEIEAIVGNALRAARKHAVAAPHLETMYAIAKLVERKLGHTRDRAESL